MSRWDYDTVFYRVFCITLLAVAFTFTVILTNVFVDIDGLLSKKDKVKTPKPEAEPIQNDLSEPSGVINVNMVPEDKSEDVYDDKDYQDSNDLYRSKRSLEASGRLFHIKDPKVKKLLTNHLANLLDELDEEESIINVKHYSQDSAIDGAVNTTDQTKLPEESTETDSTPKKYLDAEVKNDETSTKNEAEKVIDILKDNKIELKSDKDETKNLQTINKDEILHLAMHNIILQGIIGSMSLDDVYKKVVDLIRNFENDHGRVNKDELKQFLKETYFKKPKQETKEKTTFDVLLHFMETEKQTDTKRSFAQSRNNVKQKITIKPIDSNIIIKAIINITALTNGKTNEESDINDKINGKIKLIYNGNTINFKRTDDANKTSPRTILNKSVVKTTENLNYKNIENKINSDTETNKPNQSYFKRVIHDYLRNFQKESLASSESEKVYSRKRLKRHIKIRYDNDKPEKTTTVLPKSKKDDDELFVEIETHFDCKGAKGEKKKKLIRDLIQKIQNALHSDKDEKKKKPKHWHVKKRIQSPLSSKSAAALLNKLILPLESLAHRHLDPISKSVSIHDELPIVSDDSGRNHWHRSFQGPSFFNKAINSAEMNTVDTDYSKIMSHNGIPQRLQKPLHTDISDEVFQDSSIVELGNIKFLMKDIEGTGFSIGFNQYTDEAPDQETMKLFSGLQNIIQTYHQKYDQESVPDTKQQNIYDNTQNIDDVNENQEEMDKSDQHLIQRRSINSSNDHHTNNYRFIYSHNFLPYENYQDILESDKSHLSTAKSMQAFRTKQAKKSALFIDENVFEKDLKPAEILSIADLFQRRKRSLNVKKMSTVKVNNKIHRKYLNTKRMASKKFFIDKKRNKRQIDKIRIIARDLPQAQRNSEEDIFVVSDEKIFADRALVKEVQVPEVSHNDKIPSAEHYDIISPQKDEVPYDIMIPSQKESDDNFDIVSPYIYEVSPFETQNEFTRRARHNSLMSKYPHILMSETQRSLDAGEDMFPDNTYQNSYYTETTTNAIIPTIIATPSPEEKEIAEMITPPRDKSNYRVSVKIRPKNATGMSGFKEIHTSINKSYNKNGLMYTSLVNVSQLSKVEKINKTVTRRDFDHSSIVNLKQLQELMKSLVRQHKNRLDHQLKQLQIEKEKLDTINVENTETLADKNMDSANLENSNKRLQIIQEEARKLLSKKAPTEASIATEPPTTTTTTTEYVQPTISDDTIKTKMIYTIERNENITNELLKKIDQNTGVLKTFLGKLLDNIDIPTRKTNAEAIHEELNKTGGEKQTNNNKETNKDKEIQDKQPNIVNDHMPFNFEDYHHRIPNIFFRNSQRQPNNTLGIPFVYAYQQPFGILPNKETPMASVVYHGHIHANTINNDNTRREKAFDTKDVPQAIEQNLGTNGKKDIDREFWKPKPGEKVLHDFVLKNNTKFFLDDPGNTFKADALNDQPKSVYTHLGLAVNTTKV